MNSQTIAHRSFYESQYCSDGYADRTNTDTLTGSYAWIAGMVKKYHLQNKKCLEIGCGRGQLQDIVSDYTGIDLSVNVARYLSSPFLSASATDLPFANNSFDVIWTVNVLEHVPKPERALTEMERVLKPNGLLFLSPAWQCRSWAANGYPVRPWSDFNWRGKLIKLSVPLRNSILYRSLKLFPQRLVRFAWWRLHNQPTKFLFRELVPNYEQYWMSDSDAVNSMDPFEAYLWYRSRGHSCISYPSFGRALLVRTGGLVLQMQKRV